MIRGCLALLGGLWLASAPPAVAQFTVYDPTNYAQNVLQAARSLEQIQNQLTSLQNEARNLAPLGLQAAGALNADIARTNALLNQAGRLATDVQALRSQFEREYPAEATGASRRSLADAAEARWRTALESLRRSLEVQASVTGSLSASNAQVSKLADASEGAVGALQAAQTGNQLLAVQSKQLADLTALIAAQSQADALEQARAAAAAAEGRARLQRFLGRAPR